MRIIIFLINCSLLGLYCLYSLNGTYLDTLNANNVHQVLFFPFFLTYIMCHRSSPFSTRPHPHFPLDLVRCGKYTLLNLAFVGLGKSLKNKIKLEIMFVKICAQDLCFFIRVMALIKEKVPLLWYFFLNKGHNKGGTFS